MHSATLIGLYLAILGADAPTPLNGTIISGQACYNVNDSGASLSEIVVSPPIWSPIEGLQMYAAIGKHTGSADDSGVIYDCKQIWQKDYTSKESKIRPLVPAGQFHFYHEDRLPNGVSLMYRLDDAALHEGLRRPGDRRFFSRFYATAPETSDFSVKVLFDLHPTHLAFPSIEKAAEQIGQSVAVHYFIPRKGEAVRAAVVDEERMRASIQMEANIVFDSLRHLKLEPGTVADRLFAVLSRMQLRDGDRLIPITDFLPRRDNQFWTEFSGAYEAELQRMRQADR